MALSAEHKEKMRLGRQRAAEAKKAKAERPLPEVAPVWAVRLLAGVDQLVARVEAVEHKQAAQQQAVVAVAQKQNVPVKELPWHRCDECNDVYQGPLPPFGSPRRCPECSIPGRVMRMCFKCDRPMPTEKSTLSENVVCKVCKTCPECGPEETRDPEGPVCKRCQQGTRDPVSGAWLDNGVKVCIGCNRKRLLNQVMCRKCLNDFTARSAGQFKVPVDTTPQVDMGAVAPDMDIQSHALSNAPYQQPSTVIATPQGPRVITAGMAPASMG